MAAEITGKLLLESELPQLPAAPVFWADSPVNWILVTLSVLVLVLLLRRLGGILPYLLSGLARWKELATLEDSVRLSRDRSTVALACVVPFCLTVSYSGLFLPGLLEGLSFGARTLVIIGLAVALLLLRAFLVLAAWHPSAGSRENYLLASRVLYDEGILWTLCMAAACGLCRIFGANPLTLKTVLMYVCGFFFFLICLRRTQILSNTCNQFTSILYLCGLELFTAAIPVVLAVVL